MTGMPYRLWSESGPAGSSAVYNGELIDSDHVPQLRPRVRWAGLQENRRDETFGVIEAWTAERGWSEIRRYPGSGLFLMDRPPFAGGDWRAAARQDLDRLMEAGRIFFAAPAPETVEPFGPSGDLRQA